MTPPHGSSSPEPLPDGPRILILTTFDLDEYVYSALRAGVSGFMLKDALAAELLSAIRVVAEGDAIVAPPITRRLIERQSAPPATRCPAPRPNSASSSSANARCST